ncbi:MAG: efflux RND transporter periplasmic adaptor subunit [Bacterioplanes sp.]|nr:efflux RND transporter periplasmic adaptor subunit [Bacterioplanes sp.]
MNNEQHQQAIRLGLVQSTSPRRWWLMMVIFLLAFGGLIGWWMLAEKDAQTLYKTAPVQRGDLRVTVNATGKISPKDQVDVSSELSGIVQAVYVDFNDRVQQGQPLAQLDTSKISATVLQKQSSVRSSEAQLQTAQANLEEAQLNLTYYQTVWAASDGKHPSQQVMNSARISVCKAEASLQQALASLDVAKADLEIAESDLQKSQIMAPIDGVVLSRSVEVGQTVASSLSAPTLFLLARDLREMELLVEIDEADIGSIRAGQSATFTVSAYPGRVFTANVMQVRLTSGSASGNVVSYQTVLSVSNDDLALFPNMTAMTDIEIAAAKRVLTIDNAALRYRPNAPVATSSRATDSSVLNNLVPQRVSGMGRRPRNQDNESSARVSTNARPATVWVLRDGQPQSVSITVGLTSGARTEVLSGELVEGDLVISDAVQVNR